MRSVRLRFASCVHWHYCGKNLDHLIGFFAFCESPFLSNVQKTLASKVKLQMGLQKFFTRYLVMLVSTHAHLSGSINFPKMQL
ncbi:hypothetical protein P609_11565 [Comamonas thiooxydans]|nr:hypothetical protein P609_11565 [Comamonas thiooxydans]